MIDCGLVKVTPFSVFPKSITPIAFESILYKFPLDNFAKIARGGSINSSSENSSYIVLKIYSNPTTRQYILLKFLSKINLCNDAAE